MQLIEKFFRYVIFFSNLFSQIAFGQVNFIPGKIINLHGDTIQGLIDYREWDRNPVKVVFKENSTSEEQKYTPHDIAGFQVLDEFYVSAVIKWETSPSNSNEIHFDPVLRFQVDTVFLQSLVYGEKSLYHYKSQSGRESFYIKKNEEYEPLIYMKYFTQMNGKLYVGENKSFTGQLANYFDDCSSIQPKINYVRYDEKSLQKLFENYYDCIQSDDFQKKKTEKTMFETSIFTGASLSSLDFVSMNQSVLVKTDYNNSFDFTAGLSLNMYLLRNHRKFSFNNEIQYSSFNFHGYYNDIIIEDLTSITTTKFESTYLKINTSICYRYPIKNSYIYLNGGISNGFALSETNYKKTETTRFSWVRIIEEVAIKEVKKHELGYILGSGLKYKRVFFEVRYEKGTGMSAYVNLKSNVHRYYFLLGYTF